MAVERQVHPILLLELLEALPGHWLSERSVSAVEETGRVAEDAMSDEYQPRLFLPVDRGEAVLDELVLLRAFPPVVLAVRNAEPKHAIICGVPVEQDQKGFVSGEVSLLTIQQCSYMID